MDVSLTGSSGTPPNVPSLRSSSPAQLLGPLQDRNILTPPNGPAQPLGPLQDRNIMTPPNGPAELLGPLQDRNFIPSAFTQPLPVDGDIQGPHSEPAAAMLPTVDGDAMDTGEWTAARSRKRRGSTSSAATGHSRSQDLAAGPATDQSQRIPPLIFQRPSDWNKVIRRLHRVTPHDTLTAICQGANSIRLMTTTVESFRLAQKLLTDAQIPFHTYALPEERELKVEVIGIPSDTDTDLIKQEIEHKGYTVSSVTPLYSPGRRIPRNAFLVKIRKVGNYQTIYSETSLLYLRIRVAAFEPRPGPKQCYNCQRHGHSSLFCHMPTRCVRCGGDHHKDSCPIPRASGTAKCANCGEAHPASYRGCKTFQDMLKKQRPRMPSQGRRTATLAPPRRPAPPSSANADTNPAAAPVSTAAAAASALTPASPGAPSYAAVAAPTPAHNPAQQTQASAVPKKKKAKKVKTSAPQPRQPTADAPQPASTTLPLPRQPQPHPQPDNGIMFRQSPPVPQASSLTEGSTDPTFTDRLKAWVDNIVPQLLAAKDV